MPALLTTMSSPPKCAAISFTTASMSSRSATSSVQAFAISPLVTISAATACAPSALKSVTATLAPSAANTRAVARPMPPAAPVTRTVNPATERLNCLESDMEYSLKLVVHCRIDKAGTDLQRGQTMQEKGSEMNELDFSAKQVLVVGGSSGIGNGIAQAFRAKGARVHVCGTRAGAGDYSVSEGSDLAGLNYAQLDVNDTKAIENFKPTFDRLDVLVLAQGAVIYRRGEFEMSGFRHVLEVNLISLMACATRFYQMLSAANGSLIIVSSTAAYHSTKGNPAYNASKTGAVGLPRTLGEAWAEDGIRVNGIAPGLVDTKMTKVTTENPKRLEAAIGRIPLKRLGTPADMAGAALFLASPLAAYIVGQTLVVDGGLIL